jgi:hypothetical protein
MKIFKVNHREYLKKFLFAAIVLLFFTGTALAGDDDEVDYSGNAVSYIGGLGGVSHEPTSVYILLAAAAVLSFFVVLLKPAAGMVLAMVIFPFVTQSAAMTLPKMFVSIVLFGFFVAWIAGKIASSKHRTLEKDYNGAEQALLFFAVYLIVNAIYAMVSGIPALEITRDAMPFFSLIVFLIAKRFIKNRESFATLEKVQFVIMIIAAVDLTGIVLFHFHLLRVVVALSTFQNLGLFYICIIGLICWNHSRRLLIFGALVTAAYLVATDNRTQFLSAVIGAIFVAVVTKMTKAKITMMFSVSVLLITVLYFVAHYDPEAIKKKTIKLREMQDVHSDMSMVDRIGEAKQCFQIFIENPVLGVGIGYTYRLYRESLITSKTARLKTYWVTNFTHSDFMFMLSKIGAVGLLLYLWFCYKMSRLAWLIWKKGSNPETRSKGLICFMILVNSLIIGQSTPVVQTRDDMFFLCLIMGYTYCLYRFHVDEQFAEGPKKRVGRLSLSGLPASDQLRRAAAIQDF